MSRVLVIGDLHLPAVRKGYLQFCKDLYEEWECDTVVFIGDIVDWHAISFWTKEPNCPGSADEYKLAKKCVKEWSSVFPKAKICIGNHDERPTRLAKTVNIPEFMLKPYSELWDTPGWEWEYRWKIDDVNYRHGSGARGGIHPAWNIMNKIHKSVVIGHLHARAGIKWSTNDETRMFAMDVGCGIDEKAWQFIYGRDTVDRPTLAAGVILDGVPYHEIMPCSKGEKYHDSKFRGYRIKKKH